MIRVRQVTVPVFCDTPQELKKRVAQKLKRKESSILELVVRKKSIDARKKEEVHYVYEVDLTVLNPESILAAKDSSDILEVPREEYLYPVPGMLSMKSRPIVVGSGPAGLFAAYLLAECGYQPIVIERGDPMSKRIDVVEKFWESGKLDPESNVQFGEGGAGTFSDGKLNTLVKDRFYRGKKVFETFVTHGAPEEILYLQKPHVGTDKIRSVVVHMRKKIEAMGGEFRYRTCLTNLVVKDQKLEAIEVNGQEIIPCQQLVLAIGHSARDTFQMLQEQGLAMKAKPFAVGLRIQHSQQMIDQSQYGRFAKELPPASYKLSYTASTGRGVYSFCMCPGGYVVNASSEPERLVVNGMSNYQRESTNANSAIVVTVGPSDFGTEPLAGVSFQRKLEEKAFALGQGKIPLQRWQDFKENRASSSFGTLSPVLKGDFRFANLHDLFSEEITTSLKEGICAFDRKIPGFADDDVLIAGVESRTSSPLHIERDESCQANIQGIYPCGEGSGYAGGITTACMDGLKVGEEIIKQYRPFSS